MFEKRSNNEDNDDFDDTNAMHTIMTKQEMEKKRKTVLQRPQVVY